MTQLSPNFSLAELTKVSKYPDNTPGQAEMFALEAWCENIGEKVREALGPVTCTSGYRNPRVNKLVGGAVSSQHLKGEAVDIKVAGVHNADLWTWIVENLDFDQCIAELLSETNGQSGWVHVSYRADGKNRREAISFLGKGKYVPGLKYAS